jgi:mannose-1-phosphate guanylyltransferase
MARVKRSDNYAVVLSGGIGSRFWPLSRPLKPKQFLGLCSKKPMIEETILRLKGLIRGRNFYIAANKQHSKRLKSCAGTLGVPLKNILFEPEAKNTLAPIVVLADRINKLSPESVVLVLPCDHFVSHPNKFLQTIKQAIAVARQGYIVTLGIRPSRPETGYGYIRINPKSRIQNPEFSRPMVKFRAGSRYQFNRLAVKTQDAKLKTQDSNDFYKIEKFIEKPRLSLAKKFVKDKRYFWNNGIFIFKPGVVLAEVKRILPGAYRIINKIKNEKDARKLWPSLPRISFDYAIMQKTRKAAVLPADYGWSDLGSWKAVEEIMPRDKHGNVFKGNCLDIDSRNTLVWSDKRLIATLGLKDLIIVDTEDALLVCQKDMAQQVKQVVQLLKKRNAGRKP